MSLKFNKETNTEHKIKLDSTLISCMWQSGIASVGQKVKLQVVTSFVGTGAKIKITGKTEEGKKLGKISDTIRNNKYVGELEIPEKAKLGDQAYFEVELPNNSLSGESNRIPIVPHIEVSNLKWSSKVIRRGDIVTMTADVEGCPNHTVAEVIIYEFNSERAHDRVTKLPAEIIDKKIEVKWEFKFSEKSKQDIPTEEEYQKYDENKHYEHPEYFFILKIAGKEFGKGQKPKLLRFKDWVEVTLKDSEGNLRSDAKYIFHSPDGKKIEGTLDSNGYTKIEDVSPGRCIFEFPE